jgi:hypothetical protein
MAYPELRRLQETDMTNIRCVLKYMRKKNIKVFGGL